MMPRLTPIEAEVAPLDGMAQRIERRAQVKRDFEIFVSCI